MRLPLQDLWSMHPKLLGHPTDLPRLGALALQRARHTSPVPAAVHHGGRASTAEVEWLAQDLTLLETHDGNRVTENGAEAVALVYANVWAGWVVKRRLQRSLRADWLLQNEEGWLAMRDVRLAEQPKAILSRA